MIKTIRRSVFLVAAFLCIGALFWDYQLKRTEVNEPRKAVVETGHIVPYPVSGVIIYATKNEADNEAIIHAIELIAGPVLIVSLLSFRLFPLETLADPKNPN
jgi:hypothetical protein